MNFFYSVREYLAPVIKNSRFAETGVLTPDEFVAAGDFLVYKCPTWQWESGTESKRREYLPADRQFLVTRNVPCLKRIKQMEYSENEDDEVEAEGEEGWVATHCGHDSTTAPGEISDIPALDDAEAEEEAEAALQKLRLDDERAAAKEAEEEVPVDMDEIPDMDDEEEGMGEGVTEEADPAVLVPSFPIERGNIVKTRTYDLYITYDKYYQTPRMWLFGYDEHRQPLTSPQIFEDVSQDHAKKTVTIEPHPHLDLAMASVHPCRHASVMKKIIERVSEKEGEEPLRVDQYLVLFLKFMSSVLPTIDYDFSIAGR